MSVWAMRQPRDKEEGIVMYCVLSESVVKMQKKGQRRAGK